MYTLKRERISFNKESKANLPLIITGVMSAILIVTDLPQCVIDIVNIYLRISVGIFFLFFKFLVIVITSLLFVKKTMNSYKG